MYCICICVNSKCCFDGDIHSVLHVLGSDTASCGEDDGGWGVAALHDGFRIQVDGRPDLPTQSVSIQQPDNLTDFSFKPYFHEIGDDENRWDYGVECSAVINKQLPNIVGICGSDG